MENPFILYDVKSNAAAPTKVPKLAAINEAQLCAHLNLVGMTGFEPATSWSQTTRATNCATSREHMVLYQKNIHLSIDKVQSYRKGRPQVALFIIFLF